MPEPTPQSILASINDLTSRLVETGLVDDQEWAKLNVTATSSEVTTRNPVNATVLKDVPYSDIYEHQLERRAFNVVLLDRALIQMSYEWSGSSLSRHRLAFLPSPSLIEYQTDPNLYIHEVPFVEVVGNQVVSVPLRVDYDVRPTVQVGGAHPAAHLTLGQYKHCRIPVSAAMTPEVFVHFILRHFYSTPEMPEPTIGLNLGTCFPFSEPPVESDLVHVHSPGNRNSA